ncbi:cytochrome c oxidase subunit 6a, mitochondrial isoform X1 [Rhodamnia argentea]|uniref:Cytochrome c oxidase subunit 6a, mitochondrial isoform X1 n=1 Tax=Rhodamnia argentea TaxID=178133 RepID=A0ABM3GUN5_9MYRT|nr:cytochrome c oxidase subunit 6a, mitochondrial isoform X1 [Rhodamnia argentea]
MAMATVRSALLRSSLRGGSRPSSVPKRNFASSAHDDEREMAKWEKVTYAGIVTCSILAIYNLSKGHPHHEEPPVLMDFLKSSTTEITSSSNMDLFGSHPCLANSFAHTS